MAKAESKPALPAVPGFLVGRAVAQGYSGTVYYATAASSGRPVALKVLDTARLGGPIHRARFAREAELLVKSPHPCLVPVVERDLESDPPYIAFAWMGGGDLTRRTRRKELLPVRDTLAAVARVARALDHLHRHGIVHRDLKPANLLCDDEGQAYLGDLGLGKDLTSDALTASGQIVGTWAYMAPEVQDGEAATAPSDVYSLAMVLVELLTGELPRRSSRGIQLPDLARLGPAAERLLPVIRECLRTEPDDRPRSAAVLADACEAAGGSV